ncbi:DUF1350 family protein [Prochlorococcus marinus]|uniref:Alpha/beta hydrolase n=1 Tax=Prochlorococcus marinus (strain MIT 9211) TaxID=93059 RepID=A9B9Z4_PROM4|nr:DUF1350 family protein [Prochlorococcus marinus]ABX08656.1 conserved hypothetical protein [Prochlorococcus marinus str. MIT 9211]
MYTWRLIERTWCSWPPKPIGLIEMIGGSYLATTPHISYKLLLEGLTRRNIAVHAWRYIPGLDHQSQANEAWRNFRLCKTKLDLRVGVMPSSLRIGHSLGCKLHLLAPDLGRNSKAFIGLCFNNFTADQSIPLVEKVSKRLNIRTEFSPSPQETLKLITKKYSQPRNLLIKFTQDNLDQTDLLLESLQNRINDQSQAIELEGNHLTPASAGLRKNVLGSWAYDQRKSQRLEILIDTIYKYLLN